MRGGGEEGVALRGWVSALGLLWCKFSCEKMGFCYIVSISIQSVEYFGEFHNISVLWDVWLLSGDVGNRVFLKKMSWERKKTVVLSRQMCCYGLFYDIG